MIKQSNSWKLYIVRCRTKELYVGICTDLEQRLLLHNKGQACRYTKFRKPVTLIYCENCLDYASARKRETQIKKYSRKKKLELIGKFTDLSSQ